MQRRTFPALLSQVPYLFALALLSPLNLFAAGQISLPVHYDTLPNGLKLIVVPDTNVAVVSCRLYYFVGSMYEGAGTTGLSHMYEHMMFKGTRTLGTSNYKKEIPYMLTLDSIDSRIAQLHQSATPANDSLLAQLKSTSDSILDKQRTIIKKDEIWELYQNAGGSNLNAWTGDDMTAYIVTLPKNKIEMFFWIEADRMRNPVLREFLSERDVIMEERRMRYDNRPMGTYWERLNALFYVAHPYRNPTIGWASDIASYTRVKLEDHVKRYYTPDNAVIVLVGNVDKKQSTEAIRRYFGAIPRSATPKQEIVTREPAPVGQTRFVMERESEPRIDIMFHIPGYPNEDLFPLDVVEGVLSGRSGRLYERLVKKEQLATDAGASNSFRLHNGEFSVWATLKTGVKPADVEKILIEEIDKLKSNPPTPSEMERNKNGIRMSFVSNLRSLEGVSDRLAWFERLHSWKDMFEYPEKIAAIPPQAIPPVVKKYLDSKVATIGILSAPAQPDTGDKKASRK